MQRTAEKAWDRGVIGIRDRGMRTAGVVKIWGGWLWLFDPGSLTLVTVLPCIEKVEDFASVQQFKHDREMIRKRKLKLRKSRKGSGKR